MTTHAHFRPGAVHTGRPRWVRIVPPAIVSVIGLVLTLLIVSTVRDRERSAAQRSFDERASTLAARLQASFELPIEVLEGIRSLVTADADLGLADFERYAVSALGRHPAITALEWAPVVRADEREAFEAAAQVQGQVGFRITELAYEGKMEAAGARDLYVPLLYMVPPSPAIGFDLASETTRREIAWRARDLGTPVASGRFTLAEDAAGTPAVALYRPVYRFGATASSAEERRSALIGFAIAVFRLDRLLERALPEAERTGLDLLVRDVGASGADAELYASRPGMATERREGRIDWQSRFDFAGRTWEVLIARAEPFSPSGVWWVVLLAGLVVTTLVAFGTRALRTILDLRREVAEALELGQYTLVEKIGRGGMGTVYRAQHAMLRRPTAIKLLGAGSGINVKRFAREVQITAQLTHPNTIAIYDYGRTPDGQFYYAMELLDGMSLEELVVLDGAQPAARVVHLLRQICGALDEAHAVGLIHRDIKPANLMLTRRGQLYDFIKVVDFGLVKNTEHSDASETGAGSVVGTPLYLSPEAITDQAEIDGRADLYAVGAVAYFLLTGTDVFSGTTVVEICAKHLRTPPDPMATRGVVVPARLEALVLRCLAKDPDARPATAGSIIEDLDAMDVRVWTQRDAETWWNTTGAEVRRRAEASREEEMTREMPQGKISLAIERRDR